MTFDPAEIDRDGISTRHKVVIADCVMAWGAFDCQLRALVTALEGKHLDQGAVDYSRLWARMAWTKLHQRLRDNGASAEVRALVADHKKSYDRHIEARDLIAHSGCVGVWKQDPEYLVFAPFEAHEPGQMVIVRQPLDVIRASTAWASAFSEMAGNALRALGY